MKQKDILFLLTAIFLLVLAWISFTVYHSAITSKINKEIIEQTTPITPDFNTFILQGLKTRQHINPLNDFSASVVYTSPTPTVAPLQSVVQNAPTGIPTPAIPGTSSLSTPSPTPSIQTPKESSLL